MTIGKDLAVSGYLVHLMGCALSGREPDNLPDECSWDDVVSRARENSILGLVWRAARELDGIPDDLRASCERHSRMLALHNVGYEAERVAVCEALHKAGLSTLALKGASLVPRYPDHSMREVGDNDVLCGVVARDTAGFYHGVADEGQAEKVRRRALRVMTGLGYRLTGKPNEYHLHFHKDPALTFELHDALFPNGWTFSRYYRDPWRLVRPVGKPTADCGEGLELVFPLEDEYVYLLAHAYKHAQSKGTGLRVLADIMVMNETVGDDLDRDYIRRQLSELAILEFARSLERLAYAIHDDVPLTVEQELAVSHMAGCGTYGNEAEGVRIRMRRAIREGRSPLLAEIVRFFSLKTVCGNDKFGVIGQKVCMG